MKSRFIVFLCFGIQISAMEQPEKASCEWDVQIFRSGNKIYENLSNRYLKDSGIILKEKFVLDVGSKTGKVSHIMAQLAGPSGLVMGIDPDKNMISDANKRYGQKQQNLSFHQDSLETVESSQHSLKFNVATVFNVFDVLENKLEACKKIHKCLCPNGEILVNVGSGEPFDLEVTREMITDIPLMGKILYSFGLSGALEKPYPTEEEYKNIFKTAGFDIISFTKKMNTFVFETSDEFSAMKRPVVMNSPEMKRLPWYMRGWVFNQFIEKFLTKLEQNEDGHYLYFVKEILIHAHKSEKK